MTYPSLRIAIDAGFLGVEASNVVALRMIKLALGGARAKADTGAKIEDAAPSIVNVKSQARESGVKKAPAASLI